MTGTGRYLIFGEILQPLNLMPNEFTVTVALTAITDCGERTTTQTILIRKCANTGQPRVIQVSPNPTQADVSVTIVNADGSPFTVGSEGSKVLIVAANNGSGIIDEKIYANGASLNVSQLPEGVYKIFVWTGDPLPLEKGFVIAR